MTKTLTIIIGLRSTISESQKKIIKNSIVISSDFLKFQKKIMKIKKYNFNLIFNNFYPSAKIDKVNEKNYLQLNELCLKNLSLILSILNPRKIKKIFYTSSSSVYIFSKELNHDFIDHKNRRLQAAYKLAAENLITNYSLRNKIINTMLKQGISVRPVWKLMHKIKYLSIYPKMNLENSIKAEKSLISIPSSPSLIR